MKAYNICISWLLLSVLLQGCKEHQTTPTKYPITINFTHYVGEEQLQTEKLVYRNSAGNVFSVIKLQYIISEVQLISNSGNKVTLTEGYHFVDIADEGSLTFFPTVEIDAGDFDGITFVFGLTEERNLSGVYPDLNALSWSWPESLGGGYHFMKLEGRFNTETGLLKPYTTHMGTAREITGTDTLFHANYAVLDITDTPFTIRESSTIELRMDISQWYDDPHIWNLDTLSTMIMPVYHAQQALRANAHNVFSISGVTTN